MEILPLLKMDEGGQQKDEETGQRECGEKRNEVITCTSRKEEGG